MRRRSLQQQQHRLCNLDNSLLLLFLLLLPLNGGIFAGQELRSGGCSIALNVRGDIENSLLLFVSSPPTRAIEGVVCCGRKRNPDILAIDIIGRHLWYQWYEFTSSVIEM